MQGGRHRETKGKGGKEASNRVGRNDRLGYGRDGVDVQEWGGGQKVGSSQEKSGSLDQEV